MPPKAPQLNMSLINGPLDLPYPPNNILFHPHYGPQNIKGGNKLEDYYKKLKLLYNIFNDIGDLKGKELIASLLKRLLKGSGKDSQKCPKMHPQKELEFANQQRKPPILKLDEKNIKHNEFVLSKATGKGKENIINKSIRHLENFRDEEEDPKKRDILNNDINILKGNGKCIDKIDKVINKIGLRVPPIFEIIYDISKELLEKYFDKMKGSGKITESKKKNLFNATLNEIDYACLKKIPNYENINKEDVLKVIKKAYEDFS